MNKNFEYLNSYKNLITEWNDLYAESKKAKDGKECKSNKCKKPVAKSEKKECTCGKKDCPICGKKTIIEDGDAMEECKCGKSGCTCKEEIDEAATASVFKIITVDVCTEDITTDDLEAAAKKAGLEATVVDDEGPGAGWPVMRFGGTEDALRKFYDENFNVDGNAEDFDALLENADEWEIYTDVCTDDITLEKFCEACEKEGINVEVVEEEGPGAKYPFVKIYGDIDSLKNFWDKHFNVNGTGDSFIEMANTRWNGNGFASECGTVSEDLDDQGFKLRPHGCIETEYCDDEVSLADFAEEVMDKYTVSVMVCGKSEQGYPEIKLCGDKNELEELWNEYFNINGSGEAFDVVYNPYPDKSINNECGTVSEDVEAASPEDTANKLDDSEATIPTPDLKAYLVSVLPSEEELNKLDSGEEFPEFLKDSSKTEELINALTKIKDKVAAGKITKPAENAAE